MPYESLGSRELFVGQLPQGFDPFPFKDNLAYPILATFTNLDLGNIYSTVILRFGIFVPGEPDLVLSEYVRLDIIDLPQLIYFPTTGLFGDDGDCIIFAERRSYYVGGGDSTGTTLELAINEDNAIKSWI